MSGAIPLTQRNLHAIAARAKDASPEELRELRDAIQRRQFVEDIMELNGTFFPGLDAIKKANVAHETSATLKERMQEMQKQHIQDVRTLYQWQAQDYYDDMLDLAQSKPDIEGPGAESLYRHSRLNFDLANAFDNNLDRLNHAYLSSIAPIARERNMHREREEAIQRRRDQQFPASIGDFHAIRNKDAQVRVARFLTSKDDVRERMMDEFKWAWRQVIPLVSDHSRNESFQAEVQSLLRDIEVQDPRKARRDPPPVVTAS